MLVENRLSHRMPPIEVEKTDFYKLAAQTKTKDVRGPLRSCSASPHGAGLGSLEHDHPQKRHCPFLVLSVYTAPPRQWDEEKIRDAAEELKRQLADPSREMIGRRQVEDVGRAVQESGGSSTTAATSRAVSLLVPLGPWVPGGRCQPTPCHAPLQWRRGALGRCWCPRRC
jgi:hypothetical protein